MPAVALRLAHDPGGNAEFRRSREDGLGTKRLDDDRELLHDVNICGTNRLVFDVIGPRSSRMPMPQALPFTSQLPITG